MRLADYTKRLFYLLTRTFRHVLEFMGVGQRAENRMFEGKINRTQPVDWLERTRDIPPEKWIDFSAETIDQPRPATTKQVLAIEETAEKPFDKKRAQLGQKINKSAESRIKDPSVPIADSSFLIFLTSDKKSPSRPSESLEDRPEPFTELILNKEGAPAEQKRHFRLRSSSQDFYGTPESSIGPDLSELSDHNTSEPVRTTSVPTKKGPGKTDFSTAPKLARADSPLDHIDAPNRQLRLLMETSSRKDFEKPMVEPGFESPEQDGSTDFAVAPKIKRSMDKLNYFSAWQRAVHDVPEKVIQETIQKSDDTSYRFSFASQPWVELPDEFLREPIDEIISKRSDAEHLLYLEREQAWRKTQ